jgi:acetyl esterase/lipase
MMHHDNTAAAHDILAPAAAAPRWRARLLTALSLLLALLTATTAFYMLKPVSWTGPGVLGVAAFFFPLQLLVVTVIAGVLAWLAWRNRAEAAAVLFCAVVAATAIMALAPVISMWHFARQQGVQLSLAEYARHGLSTNDGAPEPARTVEYGIAPDGSRLLLDIWLPTGSAGAGSGGGTRPVIVKIHGGGWVAGTRGGANDWNRWLNERGYAVFDVEYRMPPPLRWKDEVGDVKCALGWVVANAARYGLDTSRISTMGFSAGGNLAMLAAYSVDDPELPPSCHVPPVPVRAVINLYGPSDLPLGYRSSGSPDYSRAVLTAYTGGAPTDVPERYRALSPISHIRAGTPPTITFLGLRDRIVTVEQAAELQAALAQAGVAHPTWLLPATDHGFDFNWGGFNTQFARTKVEQFLREQG